MDGPSENPTICGDPLRAFGPSLGLRRPSLLRPRRPAPNPRSFPKPKAALGLEGSVGLKGQGGGREDRAKGGPGKNQGIGQSAGNLGPPSPFQAGKPPVWGEGSPTRGPLGPRSGTAPMKQFPQRLHVGNLARDKGLTFLLAISPGSTGPGGTPGPSLLGGVAQLAPHWLGVTAQADPRP